MRSKTRLAGLPVPRPVPRPVLLPLLMTVLLAACGQATGPGDDAVSSGNSLTGALAGQDCVVIVLDSLHADHLASYGGDARVAPHLDALAADGVRFSRVWSASSWTLPSTASLFTGMYQETHGVDPVGGATDRRLDATASTLAELFADAGYETRAYTQSPFPTERFGLSQGFERTLEVRTDGPPLPGRLAADLGDRSERPLFAYVHVIRPHTPYDAPQQHRDLFVDPEYDGPVMGLESEIDAHNTHRAVLRGADLAQLQALYRANIRQADAELAAVLALFDLTRTLVLVTSDHGEAMGQHGKLGHSWTSFEEYVAIPLVLSHPALPAGRVEDTPVSTVDVLPTLAELFGLPVPAASQGVSLTGLLEGRSLDRQRIFTSSRTDEGGRRYVASFDGRWKYLRWDPVGLERLFDLASDAGESLDHSRQEVQVLKRSRESLDRWLNSQVPRYWQDLEGALDPETEARLREMGYLR